MRSILILITIIFSSTIYAGEASVKEEEVKQFMAQYIQSYNVYLSAGESAKIRNVTANFFEPTFQVPEKGAPAVAATRDVLDQSFARFVGFMQSKGAQTFEWNALQVVGLGENKALASGVAVIRDKAGKEVDRRSSIYSLYKSEEGWKITMLQSHPIKDVPTLRASS